MTGRRLRRTCATLAVAVGAVAAGAGCGVVGERTETCVSWVWFETPAAALADATVAVRTDGPARPAGTAELFGVDARVHTVRVAEVLKGADVQVGQELDVLSTPVTCTGGEVYPDGDPVDTDGPLVLFLHRDDDAGGWRTITPDQGAVAPTEDGRVPDAWPSR